MALFGTKKTGLKKKVQGSGKTFKKLRGKKTFLGATVSKTGSGATGKSSKSKSSKKRKYTTRSKTAKK